MPKHLAAILCLALLALSATGCTKCGWIWEDGTHACHSDALPGR
jgi:hypothetical protein